MTLNFDFSNKQSDSRNMFLYSMMVPDSDFVWAMPDGSQLAEAKFTRVAETTDSGDYKCTSTIMRGKDTIETTTVINVQVKKSHLISIYPYK